ncbi:hypothetical protein ACFZDK_23275 [Streptomyces sp. NPDC007901]|uniref:hypothetical protein n=1 Tax=Streptomyces sp. NPDC007901 TaxID=3364785 RepID=UPI0036EDF9A1
MQPSASLPSAASRESSQASEPTVSFSQNGKTWVLYYSNTEVDAMPEGDGVFTTVTILDGVGKPAQYDIDVSIGGGVDWTASNEFRIEGMATRGVKSQASTAGGPHLAPFRSNRRSTSARRIPTEGAGDGFLGPGSAAGTRGSHARQVAVDARCRDHPVRSAEATTATAVLTID